jgi:DNA-binding protein HU-beta
MARIVCPLNAEKRWSNSCAVLRYPALLKALVQAASSASYQQTPSFFNIFRRGALKPLTGAVLRIHLFTSNNTHLTKPYKNMGMNKAELIESVAAEAKISKADAKRAIDAFVNNTTKALKKGDRVALVGFGTFSITKRAARKGRNPQTGKEIKIAAKKVVKFKAGADLANRVK